MAVPNVSNMNTIDISSFFSNRNQYAAFLVVAMTATLYLNQFEKKKSLFLVFILQFLCMLSTASRAALFSSLILILLTVLQTKKTSKKWIITVLAFVVGVGILVNTGIFDFFIEKYIRWEQSADSGRFELWEYAWDIIKDNFFTGVGFYTGVDIAVDNGMLLTQFHNMFLDLLVDGGCFELLLLVYVFYKIYKRCARRCRDKALLSICRASFAAFVFYACFESASVLAFSYGDTLYTIFYMSLPLLLANIKKDEDNRTASMHARASAL